MRNKFLLTFIYKTVVLLRFELLFSFKILIWPSFLRFYLVSSCREDFLSSQGNLAPRLALLVFEVEKQQTSLEIWMILDIIHVLILTSLNLFHSSTVSHRHQIKPPLLVFSWPIDFISSSSCNISSMLIILLCCAI